MVDYHARGCDTMQSLKDMANKLRIDCIDATQASESGHVTSCSSSAEIMSVLYFNTLRYDLKFPKDPRSDRFVLSKGHAAPILYAVWAEAGLFPVKDLLKLRTIDSDLEGHPTPRLNFVDVATGSLGQGISIAAGMAYTGKYFDKSEYRVYCLLGDGESAEGSVWEALAFSSFYKLDNLVAIFDINRLGQCGPTMLQHDVDVFKNRLESFGWNTYVVDGHDVKALCKAFHDAKSVKEKPTCILAKTLKGKGFPGIEDSPGWHSKILGPRAESVIKIIKGRMNSQGPWNLGPQCITATVPDVDITNVMLAEPPNYLMEQEVAIRVAYNDAVVKLSKNNPRVIALDGETNTSTYSYIFKDAYPDRYIEGYIAEQNLVGVAIGCAARDRNIVFCNGFAAFLTRAFDQIRMGAISFTNVNFVGSHAGVCIGKDGASQMAMEDIAMFRSLPGSTVFCPSDAVSMQRATELAAGTKGICYIRSSRTVIPVMYRNDELFEIGKAKVVRKSDTDKVTVIGSCVTLVEAMKAADELASKGVNIRVIDPFTLKPLDTETILTNARETGGNIITVEDHYIWGGLGDTVAGCLSEERDLCIKKLAVTSVPHSGKPDELMKKYGINAQCIVNAVYSMLK
ncbi:transketolase-like protein 2 [Ruditapes philippinarum]|uniref:transketolase-like protein 2 n=1 Tax=Ruditapes philippinarum TaxID=129788 RepID=UPI00295BA8D5|nr:transketolase-like protein 2 [Ruditapes philippinarum]